MKKIALADNDFEFEEELEYCDDLDLESISLDEYECPEMDRASSQRIKKLKKITGSIEKNVVTKSRLASKDKQFKIDYANSLNERQYLAATAVNGPILVIAGAGSGKTRTIVYRTAYLVENGISPESILLLTFTRKAAQQMLSKASELLNDMRCERIMGGTFHSFANYLLRRYSNLLKIRPNFTIADMVDSEDIIDLVKRKIHFDKKSRAFPRKGRIQEIISKSRNCNKSIKTLIQQEFSGLEEFIGDIRSIARSYTKYKKANNILDFDDLMEFLRTSLRTNPAFRERVQNAFDYLMVDEFQDTNTVQKEIVDLIAQKLRNIMVVGDDSQSIYGFRGTNFENILRFPETYPGCKVIKIEQNYRSNQDLLDFGNSIIENIQIGYKKRLFTANKKPGKPIVAKFFDQGEEAEYIVTNILELREKGVPLNEMAVLYRATYHGNFIQAELLKRDIPYVVYGGIRFVERRHIKDIIAYLRIILNPMDAVSWNRILTLLPGVGNAAAARLIESIQQTHGKPDFVDFSDKKYYPELKKLSETLTEAAKSNVSIPNKIKILKEYYSPILKDLEIDFEKRLTDVDVLVILAQKYEDLERFLSDFALEPPSNRFQESTTPLIDESEERPLVLSTVHSAKGLEWNTVFIPHLLDGLFPSSRTLRSFEEFEGERRLFYVACTRAKQRLYLTMPSYVSLWTDYFTLPSRFLVEIEKDRYELEKKMEKESSTL